MIAVDTSSLSAFFAGEIGPDVSLVETAMTAGNVALPPVVLTEVLSDPRPQQAMRDAVSKFITLEIREGYWERAGELSRGLREKGLRARIADALIAQSCLDYAVPLITRDADFRHFAKHCGLKLA
jgi:predicted nucleic acid-binding protein